jgi:Ca-activated chloride channel family protein
MHRFLCSLLAALSLLFLNTALAEERAPGKTIIILDASGSMWGQIDGVNKIVIAREVIGKLLGDFPENQALGLTVYGHRERGNCADIETLVSPALGTRDSILEAVNRINPRGMTPMADSVIAAAKALQYTENRATVILVSDGIETCNPDPCAAARALNEAAVDFTAHVVGFDITEAEALRQMQCMADETGGMFLTAGNAAELTVALNTVAAAVSEPEPEPAYAVTFQALQGEGGEDISDQVLWDVSNGVEMLANEAMGAPLVLELETGAYTATGYHRVNEVELTTDFIVVGSERTVTLIFPIPVPAATIIAPDSAVAGSTIEICWSGPDAAGDNIQIGKAGERGYEFYTYVAKGNPLRLQIPAEPGSYELRYRFRDRETIFTRPIAVTGAR